MHINPRNTTYVTVVTSGTSSNWQFAKLYHMLKLALFGPLASLHHKTNTCLYLFIPVLTHSLIQRGVCCADFLQTHTRLSLPVRRLSPQWVAAFSCLLPAARGRPGLPQGTTNSESWPLAWEASSCWPNSSAEMTRSSFWWSPGGKTRVSRNRP